MAIKDLVPRFGRNREQLRLRQTEADPLHGFQREMNRLFDDFFQDLPLALRPGGMGAADGFLPRVDVSETDREVRVSAELPGLDEKDLTVELGDATLTIRGEKKAEKEEKGRNWHTRELSYGSFQRVIPLPAGVRADKASARFKNGVLTVALPRKDDAVERRRAVKIEAD